MHGFMYPNSNVCLIKGEKCQYIRSVPFRPALKYPEYPFDDNILPEENHIYEMVREAFHVLGMDIINYGDVNWNPLGTIIKPGDIVVLKPNLVMHSNPSGDGVECLYTQPSVVAAVIDYCVIALKGTGTIIVGDAPMQECQFECLVEESGYKKLIEYYQKRGINIFLQDFRNVKTYVENGIHKLQSEQGQNGIVVDMTRFSSFNGLSEEHLSNMRITNYDPRILQEHHNVEKHEYLVATEILEADVIINLPKPKTHRKAGVTACLKNLVGINASKEYLPHHTIEGKKDKGDAYKNSHGVLRLSNILLDKKNMLERGRKYFLARLLAYPIRALSFLGHRVGKELYSEGSWYGNETIWRTIMDLNKILLYADKQGIMQLTPQRKIFHIADMVISGENDGPVRPSAKAVGMIVAGADAVSMDEVITALMGFELDKIPTIREARKTFPKIWIDEYYSIKSNDPRWDGKSIAYIKTNENFSFVANPGWSAVLRKDG